MHLQKRGDIIDTFLVGYPDPLRECFVFLQIIPRIFWEAVIPNTGT